MGCGWTDVAPLGGCPPADDASETEHELYATALEVAGEYLDRWTAHRFGICPVTIYPCRTQMPERGAFDVGGAPWYPALIEGEWYNLTCGYTACGGGCLSTCRHDFIRIPGPIASVTSVVLAGEVLDPASYRVVDASGLLRLDSQPWPTVQTYDDDGWTIEYDRGRSVPRGGQLALGELACEVYKALAGDSSCRLPKRLQSISREGITMTLIDSFDSLSEGYTGLWLVDSWLSSINKPKHRRASVVSPDYGFRGASAQGTRVR